MIATQNQKAKIPRKFIRRYHLKKIFYERFPDKVERKQKVEELSSLLGLANGVIRRYWSIRINDNSDITAEQLRLIAGFFNMEMEDLFNLKGEIY